MLFNAGTWPVTINDPTEERDRYHRIALAEARIAGEHEPHRLATAGHPGLVERLRAAVGLGRTASDAIACSAC